MEFVANLPHSWVGDIRDPVFTVSFEGCTYGVFAASVRQNVEIALLLGATAFMAVAVSWVLYESVVSKGRENTALAYLLGFGAIVPFWILSPMYLIKYVRWSS